MSQAAASLASAPAGSKSLWPMSYLWTGGPRADPATALMWALIWLSLAVVVTTAVLVLWGILARRSAAPAETLEGAEVMRPAGGIQWIWIGLIPTVVALVVALGWTVAVVRAIDSPAAAPALTIQVTGHQWWWEVAYEGGRPDLTFATANEIHIPTGRPVLIELRAGDVIHSFWIPRLGGKTDAIPGRTNLTWLQADQPGVYRGQCTEFCGVQHAHMALQVVAQTPAAFETWRRAQLAPAANGAAGSLSGQALFRERCGACHTVRGTQAAGVVGPDLTHVMSRATLAAGTLPNRAASLAGWISNPQALKPGARMPATDLSADELRQVAAYVETLR